MKILVSALLMIVILQFIEFSDMYCRFLQLNKQQVDLADDFLKLRPIVEKVNRL